VQSALTTISLSSGTTSQVSVNGTSQFIEFVPPVSIPVLSIKLLVALAASLALVGMQTSSYSLAGMVGPPT
jgi:hypothetical protein